MDNRFTFKDFVFAVLIVFVIGAVLFASFQFSYQEKRLSDVRDQIQSLDQTQKQQLALMSDIRDALRNGVSVGTGAATEKAQRVRQKNPDGSQYVYYPDLPQSPRDPSHLPDYAFGDWLIKNIGGEPKSIQPFVTGDMYGQISQAFALESLVGQNYETLAWEPALADKYWISADGLHFKFHLRPEVCFSDGVKMTADDVIFTFNTIMNPGVECEALRGYYDRVKGCTKIDDRTVEFEMKEPYFLAMDFVGGMPIIPEHVYKFTDPETYNHNIGMLVGSGPYLLPPGGWEKGQKVTLVRNEKYWGDRPTLERIVYPFIGNSQSMIEAFLKGEVDELSEPVEPDAEEYLHYANDPQFLKNNIAYKFSRSQAMYIYIGYNEVKPMFKDKETRQALTMLIDRKGIIKDLLEGFGAEMTGPFNVMKKQNDPSIKALPFDIEAAKKKLADAGWKMGSDGVLARDGVRFEFTLALRTGVPIRERIATRVQQWFQQAGIKMTITPYESSVLLKLLDDRNFDAVLAGWGAGGLEEDPYQIFHSDSIKDKGSNAVGYSDPVGDKLIEEARRTLDEDKRMELWHQFQKVIYDDQPYTWLYSEVDCVFINGRFKNTKPYPIGLEEGDWYVPAAQQKYRN